MNDIRKEYRLHLMSLILPPEHLGDGSDSTALYLFETLDEIPFEVHVAMDKNRVMDALDTRDQWTKNDRMREEQLKRTPVSLLEILVGLCLSLEYARKNLTDHYEAERRFYELLGNAGIHEYTPRWRILLAGTNVVNRNYAPNGEGGFFPCDRRICQQDMRKTELWMQMNEYLLEKYHA